MKGNIEFIGYPGSGKSFIVNKILEEENFNDYAINEHTIIRNLFKSRIRAQYYIFKFILLHAKLLFPWIFYLAKDLLNIKVYQRIIHIIIKLACIDYIQYNDYSKKYLLEQGILQWLWSIHEVSENNIDSLRIFLPLLNRYQPDIVFIVYNEPELIIERLLIREKKVLSIEGYSKEKHKESIMNFNKNMPIIIAFFNSIKVYYVKNYQDVYTFLENTNDKSY